MRSSAVKQCCKIEAPGIEWRMRCCSKRKPPGAAWRCLSWATKSGALKYQYPMKRTSRRARNPLNKSLISNDICRLPWISIDQITSSNEIWQLVSAISNITKLWNVIAFWCYPWKSMDIHGFPWISVMSSDGPAPLRSRHYQDPNIFALLIH